MKDKIQKFVFHTSMGRFLFRMVFRFSMHLQEVIVQKMRIDPLDAEALLKRYLRFDHDSRQLALAKLGIAAFEGVHPKNVYPYRSAFFKDRVGGDDIVLDIACGSGAVLKTLSPAILKGVGIEADPRQLLLCQSHALENLAFEKADILSFDYAEFKKKSHYTVAVFSHILEHIQDPVALVKQVAASRVLVCVPSQENWITQLKKSYGLSISSDPTHYREYDQGMLRAELTAAGYRVTFLGFNSEGELIAEGLLG